MAERRSRRTQAPELRVLPATPAALHAEESERRVIGALFLHPEAIGRALAAGLTAAAFESGPLSLPFEAATTLHGSGEEVNRPKVTAELERTGKLAEAGYSGELERLQEDTPTWHDVEYHAARVIEAAQARSVLVEHLDATRRAGYVVTLPGLEAGPQEATEERARRPPAGLEAAIIARASEAISTHPGHYYAPAADDFPGGVIVAGKDDPHVLYRWAPRVTRRVNMQDTEGGAAPVLYTVQLTDGRSIDVTHTEVRKGECWDKTGLPVNTRRHQGLMGDILTLEAAKLTAAIGTPRLGWHTLPSGELVYVRADGRCYPPELTGRILPIDLPAGLDVAARPPSRVPELAERCAIVGELLDVGAGNGRGLLLLEVCRGLRSIGASLHSPRSTVVLEAKNDAGKTSAATFARGVLFGLSYPPEPPTSTFRSTANRIAADLSTEADCPALIDDFTATMGEDPLKARMAAEALDTLLRMQADLQQARGRLNKDSRKMAGYYARSFPGVTVETFPRHLYGSAVRRMVLYRWDAGELPVSVEGSYDPDTAGTLAWHYRRSWPTLRALGDAVVALLHELGEDGARELLIERDTQWTAVLTGDLVTAEAVATNMAQRAGPILTGAELAERVLSLPAGTLTGPARLALLPHLLRQGELYREANAASADLAQQLGATVREALYARRAHLASQADRVDAAAFPSLTAQAAGVREWIDREAGGVTWDMSSGAGVRLWGVEGEWVGAELPALHALLRASREDLWSRFPVKGLGSALLEAGGFIRSTQKDAAWSWVTKIAGKPRRLARIPWSLVHAQVCEDDGPVTPVTGVTPVTDDPASNTAGVGSPVTGEVAAPVTALAPFSTAPANSPETSPAGPVTAVTGVTPVTGAEPSPMQAHAYEADPRPDLAEDAELWAAALAVEMTAAVREALLAARCQGARLYRIPAATGPGGRTRLHMEPRTGPELFRDRAAWDDFRAEYLLPHAAEIAAVLDAAALRRVPAETGCADPDGKDLVKTARRTGSGEAPDPAAVIATLAPDGRVLGRSAVDRVEVGPGMLRDALAAVAGAGGRQLELSGRPSAWLGMPAARERRGPSRGAGLHDWPALEAAKAVGWTFTTYDPASNARVPGVGAWTDARHPELVPAGRWLTLGVPEIEPTVAAVLDLDAGELLDAAQSASRALGRRWQEWEGRGFRELVERDHKADGASLAVDELPPASQQATDPTWDREPTAEEWSRSRLWVFDRSGSYLSGLPRVVVGAGRLEQLDQAQAQGAAREKRLRPGSWLVNPTGPDPLTARGLPPVLDVTSGESWVPSPTLELLRELGASFEVRAAVLWTEGSEHFRRSGASITRARAKLLERSDPAGRVALEIVKQTYTRGVQMLNREAGKAGDPWHRPDVHAAIVQRCRANLLRSLDKARVRPVAYTRKDSVAWLVDAEAPEQAAQVIGLRYGRAPGLWHEAGSWPVEEVKAAMVAPQHDGHSRAMAIVAERRGWARPGPRPLASVVAELLRRAKGDG